MLVFQNAVSCRLLAQHHGPCTCAAASDRPADVGGPVLFTAGKDGVIQVTDQRGPAFTPLFLSVREKLLCDALGGRYRSGR